MLHIFIVLCTLSTNLLCMHTDSSSSFNQENETTIQQISFPYRCCPQPYVQWSCQDRSRTSALCFLSCCITLAVREIATGLVACDTGKSCLALHKWVWCSQEAWFPCSASNRFCCIAANTISGCTLACPTAGVCTYAPWFKKNGCNCCAKINIPLGNAVEMDNYEGNK